MRTPRPCSSRSSASTSPITGICAPRTGPLLSEDGERPVGSLLIMAFDDQGQARAFAEGDPYAQAGLFESVTIRPFRKVLP